METVAHQHLLPVVLQGSMVFLVPQGLRRGKGRMLQHSQVPKEWVVALGGLRLGLLRKARILAWMAKAFPARVLPRRRDLAAMMHGVRPTKILGTQTTSEIRIHDIHLPRKPDPLHKMR